MSTEKLQALLQDTEPKKDKEHSIAFTLTLLILLSTLFTLGWNYGITELVESAGGGDPNISLLEGILAWVAVRSLMPRG